MTLWFTPAQVLAADASVIVKQYNNTEIKCFKMYSQNRKNLSNHEFSFFQNFHKTGEDSINIHFLGLTPHC